jgi:hypothetical protein
LPAVLRTGIEFIGRILSFMKNPDDLNVIGANSIEDDVYAGPTAA